MESLIRAARRRSAVLALGGVCLLTALAYASSLHGFYVYEDAIMPAPDSLRRILVRWSHEATWALFGREPDPARVVNLCWHLLNGGLVFLLARRLALTAGAVFAAGLFLLHPIQTESVAYIAARSELVTGMWVLLACLASSSGRLWLAALCAGLAITGKEVGVTAWLLVPCWAVWSRQAWSDTSRELWTAATVLMLTLFLVTVPVPVGSVFWSFYGAQVAALGRLLWLLPESLWNLSALTLDHDWTWITRPMAGMALIALPWTLFASWRASRTAGLALTWCLLALAPRLLLPLPDGLHERHLYTSMIGLSLALGAAVFPKEIA